MSGGAAPAGTSADRGARVQKRKRNRLLKMGWKKTQKTRGNRKKKASRKPAFGPVNSQPLYSENKSEDGAHVTTFDTLFAVYASS